MGLISLSQDQEKISIQIRRRSIQIPPDKAPVRAVRAEQDGEHSESLRDRGWSRACPALSSITWILLLLSFMETLKCVHLSAT